MEESGINRITSKSDWMADSDLKLRCNISALRDLPANNSMKEII